MKTILSMNKLEIALVLSGYLLALLLYTVNRVSQSDLVKELSNENYQLKTEQQSQNETILLYESYINSTNKTLNDILVKVNDLEKELNKQQTTNTGNHYVPTQTASTPVKQYSPPQAVLPTFNTEPIIEPTAIADMTFAEIFVDTWENTIIYSEVKETWDFIKLVYELKTSDKYE